MIEIIGTTNFFMLCMGDAYLIEKLICAGIANHYNSHQLGSLHAIPHNKNSYSKILQVWDWEINFQTRQILSLSSVLKIWGIPAY